MTSIVGPCHCLIAFRPASMNRVLPPYPLTYVAENSRLASTSSSTLSTRWDFSRSYGQLGYAERQLGCLLSTTRIAASSSRSVSFSDSMRMIARSPRFRGHVRNRSDIRHWRPGPPASCASGEGAARRRELARGEDATRGDFGWRLAWRRATSSAGSFPHHGRARTTRPPTVGA